MSSTDRINLPDFIIIGAQKGGTSALRHNLDAHDAIHLAPGEVHFFNRQKFWDQGLSWYGQHFEDTDALQGEKTPDYLDHPEAPARIASVVPNAKLIALLRDPVDRAYSQWNHMMQRLDRTSLRGWEDVSFEEAIDRAKRRQTPFDRLLRKGRYIEHIRLYMKHFPREQLHIGIQERFLANGAEELGRVFDFLGVERRVVVPEERNVRKYESPISPEMDRKLSRYFHKHNQRLRKFLRDPLPEWRGRS